MSRTTTAQRSHKAHHEGLLENIRQLTPNWFAVTMGTGAAYLVLNALPVSFAGKALLAQSLWIGDVGLYAIFFLMFAGRFILFRETIGPLVRHPLQSMFLGALPMGLAPIVNGFVAFAAPRLGESAYQIALNLWVFDAVLSVVIAVGVPYAMFTRQEHSLERLTAALLLPIVAPEVAASSAGVLAPHLPASVAQLVVGAGYVLWAISVPLAFAILTIVLFRLIIHKLPHRELGVTSWLTLGPIGTGALGLVTLGDAASKAFAHTALHDVASLASSFGIFGALLLWGAGLWWLACAVLFMWRYRLEGLPFNLGWWGFTFPIGVYTLATFALGRATGFDCFMHIGVVLAIALGALWIFVSCRTANALLHKEVRFRAPCLAQAHA
ncbi:TDT family transporter [Burkholderia sp. Ac-20365]|jgi:C4-dicarboxylate transporter/malic acid transport protein|uniref:TDT family transporter n=1 Tax=Burkholderia sp. Ac-20365 TaxID=2703897 RepID=UPI00197B83F9|nr:TDT family transporter [Burkholderia sp. Ac-20365]MBN3765984.1 TDT family transporter [Burkholderia sp. Ac-20365]